jgi:peptide/nickel transport system substrate-binding protein
MAGGVCKARVKLQKGGESLKVLTATAAFLCALTACHPAGSAGSGTTRLVIADPREPRSLNPLLLEGPTATTYVPLIYSYLLTIDDRGNLQPDLAVEVPSVANGGITADGRVITYHLRRNVRWQDGAPLTASDVVFTYKAIVNPDNNVFSRFGYDRVQSVTAVSPYVVRVLLREPYSPILGTFLAPNQNYGILPEHVLRGYANLNQTPLNDRPIGSGPYRLERWDRGDHITLVSNPSYFRGAPAISTITVKFVGNSNTILNQLRTHESTAYFFADPVHLGEYRSIAGLQLIRAQFAGFGDLFFNVSNPALADVQTRHAIVEALNLKEIVHNATRGTQTLNGANRGLFSWGYDPTVTPPPYDPKEAQTVLGRERRLPLTLAIESGIASSASIGVQLGQQLRQVGIDLTLRTYTPDMFRAPASAGGPVMAGTYQLAFTEIFTTADPDTQWYLGCGSIPPNGFNWSRFCDAQTERALNAGLKTYAAAARRRSASAVQRRTEGLLPFVALWSDNAIYIVPDTLRGFRPSPVSPYWNVAQWSLR